MCAAGQLFPQIHLAAPRFFVVRFPGRTAFCGAAHVLGAARGQRQEQLALWPESGELVTHTCT